MKYGWLDDYLLKNPGAKRDFKAEGQWSRCLAGGKMFAATCTPDLKYAPHNGRSMVILKCEPLLAELFRKEYPGVVPGFYSGKRSWNAVCLDGDVPGDVLRELCDRSYRLIFDKLPKKVQKELRGG